MKKLLTGILLASLTTLAIAKDIDINKAKGTEQSVILSLTPTPANMDVDQNVILTAVFDVELDAKHVQKNNVKLKYITQTKESMIDGEVAYVESDQSVTFTPSKILEEGYYEVEFKSLKAIKSNKAEQIKEIKYRFYVPEVINGYKLPPEPDSTVNNATLLGVDANDNGVRDDVERYIIKKYRNHHKIAIEIDFQLAKAYNTVIENPINAEETTKVLDAAQDCKGYFTFHADRFGDPIIIEDKSSPKKFRSININTEERITAYLTYDRALSGGVYTSLPASERKNQCSFDVEQMLRDTK